MEDKDNSINPEESTMTKKPFRSNPVSKEPEVNLENPTPDDIYRYKKYIAREEDIANQFFITFLIGTIFLFILIVGYLNSIGNQLRFSLILFLVVLLINYVIYYFIHFIKLRRFKENLREFQDSYESNILERPDSRWKFLRRQLREITADSACVIFENTNNYTNFLDMRRKAGLLLEQTPNASSANEVQYLLNSLQELIRREKNEQKGQQQWRVVNIGVILSYIAGLLFLMFYAAIFNPQLEKLEIPFFAIPLWAIIWGATGSLSAILYRFYTVRKRVQFFQESQWLIARPLIGILMSAVAYLAVQAGFVIVGGDATDSSVPLSENARRTTSLVCFLAGFSDKAYLSLINLLIERTFGNQAEEETKIHDNITEFVPGSNNDEFEEIDSPQLDKDLSAIAQIETTKITETKSNE
jgi:hypothetical protein